MSKLASLKINSVKFTYTAEQRNAIEAIERSDICVSCGGEIINDGFYQALPFWLFSYWLSIKKGKKSEKLRALKAVYDRVLQDYLEESYEHARAYILHQRFLGPEDGWNNVPAKWHKQFCAEAFTENPFQSPGNTKLKGRSLPIDYYSRREEHAKLKEMYDEVFEEYLSNIDRVMDFLESNEKNK